MPLQSVMSTALAMAIRPLRRWLIEHVALSPGQQTRRARPKSFLRRPPRARRRPSEPSCYSDIWRAQRLCERRNRVHPDILGHIVTAHAFPTPALPKAFPHRLKHPPPTAHTHRFIVRDRPSGTRPFAIHPNFPPACTPYGPVPPRPHLPPIPPAPPSPTERLKSCDLRHGLTDARPSPPSPPCGGLSSIYHLRRRPRLRPARLRRRRPPSSRPRGPAGRGGC